MQVYQPFAQPANQDKRYFQLGTSTARPAEDVRPKKDSAKFRASLVKLLGSEEAADHYIDRQKPSALIPQQRLSTSVQDAVTAALIARLSER
ncbi:hypothetical protein [Bradyrhizobium sp. Ai1a-2]|uniref:hypothetical protein n=1 Tax=Bradyrhizobium sp. Ai1a-2 TaxID=196490 RepID=UPI0004891647|nr:hypothetical protein [Bradyrhizobium sp. Ai1a-2]